MLVLQRELANWKRALKRTKKMCFSFSEDMDADADIPHANHQKLLALWETNLVEHIEEKKQKATMSSLGPEIQELSSRIHEVGRRMDRLDF